ncbi:MAG: hypothetical protein EOO54_23155, partial [Haliea sp.]
DNPDSITLTAVLTDTLPTAPGPVRVAANPNVQKTCPGNVGAAAGAASVTYASGSVIPAGGCSISVDVTASAAGVHNNTIAAGSLRTTAGNNPEPATAPLTVSTLGFVSGKVFRDNNPSPNGTFESGTDAPLEGVSIELHTGASCTSPLATGAGLVNPVTTDALGNYLFTGLAAGTYSVCEPIQPTGTVNGSTTAGTITPSAGSTGSPGVASNPTPGTSQVVGIVLNGNGAGGEVSGSVNNNFAEIALSSIAGTVFLDENNNGVQNGADTPLAGVAIELFSGNTLVASTVTLADGTYRFDGLAPGNYSVREPTQPPGTSNGLTVAGAVGNGGTPGTVTTPATLPSRINGIVLPPATASTGNNFAEIPNGRVVSGVVFLDYNNNGLLDGTSDHGIDGQLVQLTGTDINGTAVSMTTTTAPNGSYRFDGVPEGTAYTVTQPQQPDGTTNGLTVAGTTGGNASPVGTTPSTVTGINLSGANTVSAENNFAEIPAAAPDLAITKVHAPTSFTSGGSSGFYTITVRNIAPVATSGQVTVVDTLPAGLTVAQPA